MHSKAYIICNKHTNIEESVHVIFDESNNGVLSSFIVQNLKLNERSDDEEEALKEVDHDNKHPQELPLSTNL